MVAEIISVGTELLLGNIVNTNAAFLAQQCAQMGIDCFYQVTVGDNENRLSQAVQTAMERSDIILLCGGLGPTKDDITKEVCAKLCNRELILDKQSEKWIKEYFEKKGKKAPKNNQKQAMVPENAVVIPNPNGTAPGIIIEENEKILMLMPGPPLELEPMFENNMKSWLMKKTDSVLVSQIVKLCGIGESEVATLIDDMIEKQSNPTIAPYCKTGEVHLRITAKGENEKKARKLLNPVIRELKNRLHDYIYTTDENVTLEKAVADILLSSNWTVSTAESCTGGLLAGRIISVPGISAAYKKGMITYSNKAKHQMLGVKNKLLNKYGAVSKQVAEDMARGTLNVTKSDVAVAITGIAGPDGGTGEKPVGLVYISCNVKGNIKVIECHFTGDREKIRQESVSAALVLMRQCMLEYLAPK